MKPDWDKGAFAKHRSVIRLDGGSVIHVNAPPDGRKVKAIIASVTTKGRSCDVYDRREDKVTEHAPAATA